MNVCGTGNLSFSLERISGTLTLSESASAKVMPMALSLDPVPLHNKLLPRSPFGHPVRLSIAQSIIVGLCVCSREVGGVFCLSARTSQPKAWQAHK